MTRAKASLALAGALAAAIGIAGLLFPYIAPFVFAILVAILIDPLVASIERRLRWGRGAAVGIIVLGAMGVIVLIVLLLVGQLTRELSMLLDKLPELSRQAQRWTAGTWQAFELYVQHLPAPWNDIVRKGFDGLADAAIQEIQGLLGIVRLVPRMALITLVGGLTTYLLVRDKHRFASALLALLPAEGQCTARRLFRRVAGGTAGFFRAQLIVMALTFANALGAFLLFRVPFPWLLALLTGLLDLVPVLGPAAVFVPLIGGYLLTGGVGTAFGLLAAWGFILFIRQVVEPRLVASALGLHPVTALVALYLGVQVVGVTGLILGPLAAVLLKAALENASSHCH